jgi:hypothetical protein
MSQSKKRNLMGQCHEIYIFLNKAMEREAAVFIKRLLECVCHFFAYVAHFCMSER